LNASDKILEMIRNREKAKLAILKELVKKDLRWFELIDILCEKYYNKDFNANPFIEVLKEKGLIETMEGKYGITDKSAFSELLSVNQDEIEHILSMDFGKGDLAGQLGKQERYILHKVLSFGNFMTIPDLYTSIFDDIDHRSGPFSGYSSSNYGKKRAKEITTYLVKRGFLKADGSVSIPDRVLSDFVTENLNELLSELKSTEKKIKQLVEENSELSSKIEMLKTEIKKWNPTSALQSLRIPQPIRTRIDKAIARIDQRSFSEAIINCYLVSEILVNNLFNFLYPNLKNKRRKHEHKLQKIWNDEEKEKHHFPGIKVIASLLAVILWYRNKMAAHTEMKPTKEAARISVTSLIQVLTEFKRLGIRIGTQ
jgi:hypothetical protein